MHLIKEIDFVKINSQEYLMLNLINGAADIIENPVYEKVMANDYDGIQSDIIQLMIERRYLFQTEADYYYFIEELDNKMEALEESSIPNFLIVPTYDCNLNCSYCYEKTYEIKDTDISKQIQLIDQQFAIINDIVKKHKEKFPHNEEHVCVTIMGGEPLLGTNLEVITQIFQKSKENGYLVNIISNGVDLDRYLELFGDYKEVLEFIQITVDGTQEIHDTRRVFYNKKGSFQRIMKNIELGLQNGIKTYVRVNVDNSNIDNLPDLANQLVELYKWNENLKPYLYLLQDGGCAGQTYIIDEKIGIEKIFELEKKNSNMRVFYKKFHPINFIESIFENKPYMPVLRHCGASKNQYIFDCKANVYKCWHGIGNDSFRIGTFDTDIAFDQEKKERWRNRSVQNIEKCKPCKYRYICGTGCPAATHMSNEEFDINKESCVDYQTLIQTLILQYI
ncbi:MAG: radical SAM protein [Flavobacteriales bacterium]|nr:radical SAM protein [Flavobacteriales bacterium]